MVGHDGEGDDGGGGEGGGEGDGEDGLGPVCVVGVLGRLLE